ncbi:hypothetical protein [Winogradskyella sp. 3972H.M.0a.05]|uniref:hypothetical protein n=1 Tax=Winogradskyella sp. 3972H.M.0a.05 TaxID=2950277 RepID=UPI0033916D83
MDTVYEKFYKGMYLKTGGYIPSEPINQNIYPGDFFQIRDGEMILLGNIYKNSVISVENTKFNYEIALNPVNWTFSKGVTKPYSGRGTGNNPIEGEIEFSKQILAFDSPGSYFFKGKDPKACKITNWSDIKQELIIKLTQTLYSFRDVYVVTECVTMNNWTLAISNSKKGELEIAADNENFGLVDIFGHVSSKTIQSKDIEYYHRETKRKPSFFKAKKLAIQNDKLETFISEQIADKMEKNQWANDFYECDFGIELMSPNSSISSNHSISVLDMLQANELNPNTALLYFKWEDANLDDLERLFSRV